MSDDYEDERGKTYTSIKDAPYSDESIWRYMDLPRFIDMIVNHKISLARFDMFGDKMEGRLPASDFIALATELTVHNSDLFDIWPDVPQDLEDALMEAIDDDRATARTPWGTEKVTVPISAIPHTLKVIRAWEQSCRRRLFASCWYMGSSDVEYLWRTYAGPGAGGAAFAVVTTPRRLASALQPALIKDIVSGREGREEAWSLRYGLVQYSTAGTFTHPPESALDLAFYKSRFYQGDNEFRIAREVEDRSVHASPTHRAPIHFFADPRDYVDVVFSSPWNDRWVVDTVREMLAKAGIPNIIIIESDWKHHVTDEIPLMYRLPTVSLLEE